MAVQKIKDDPCKPVPAIGVPCGNSMLVTQRNPMERLSSVSSTLPKNVFFAQHRLVKWARIIGKAHDYADSQENGKEESGRKIKAAAARFVWAVENSRHFTVDKEKADDGIYWIKSNNNWFHDPVERVAYRGERAVTLGLTLPLLGLIVEFFFAKNAKQFGNMGLPTVSVALAVSFGANKIKGYYSEKAMGLGKTINRIFRDDAESVRREL